MEEDNPIFEIKYDGESEENLCEAKNQQENNSCFCSKKKKKCSKCIAKSKAQFPSEISDKGNICSKCYQNKAQIKFRNDPCCQ